MTPTIISEPISKEEWDNLVKESPLLVKVVVDISNGKLCYSTAWHAFCEKALREEGSENKNLWGANILPDDFSVDFVSLINIKQPHHPSTTIKDKDIQEKVEDITRNLMLSWKK